MVGDFQGKLQDVEAVIDSGMEVFAHNIETVKDLHWLVRDPRAHYQQTLDVLKHAKVQYVQKFVSDYLNLVIFGNRLAGSPFGLVLLGNFENFDFLAENYSENGQKSPNFGTGHKFLNALYTNPKSSPKQVSCWVSAKQTKK